MAKSKFSEDENSPKSLASAIKKGGDALDGYLGRQSARSQPVQRRLPPDTRLPWNKSYDGMLQPNKSPSLDYIYSIARPKRTFGIEAHTRTADEVIQVSRAALNYTITEHTDQIAKPKKYYPLDVNTAWELTDSARNHHASDRLKELSTPRKMYPPNIRRPEEIGRPPRAALVGSPPQKAAG